MANEMDRFRSLPAGYRDLFGTSRMLNRFFDDFMGSQSSGMMDLVPRIEVDESEDNLVLAVEMPGVPKDNINIEVKGNQLQISGEKKSEIRRGDEERRETQRFFQLVTLPDGIESANVEAEHKDGVLYLIVPKAASQQARKIELKSGDKGVLQKLKGRVAQAVGARSEETEAQAGSKKNESKTDRTDKAA